MKALEPILKQKFWILLGIAVIMTVTGWWLTTSEMVKVIQARSTQIEGAFKSIPQGSIPNDNWVNRLGEINSSQERSITSTREILWKRQRDKLMEWPADVQPKNGYLGDFSPDAKEEFKDIYEEEVTKTWKKLIPMDEDGSGLVYFPKGNMFAILRHQPDWPGQIPFKEMWEIKEDLLLLECLFETIAAVNGGIDQLRTIDMIHQIDVLELHGGGPTKQKSAPPYAPPFANAIGPLPIIPADFNIAEEWGEDGAGTAARAAAPQPVAAATASSGPSFGRVIDDDTTQPTMPQRTNTPVPLKPVNRYIQNDEKQPYRTRGFYLSVKMDHQKIPQLIAELTANNRSVWPVEVVRVQMSRLHEDLGTGVSGSANPNLLPNGRIDDSAGATNVGGDDDDGFRLGSFGGGGGGGGRSLAPQLTVPGATTAITPTELTRAAKATLDKALAHPSIAQVTLCGVFTLYQKVDEQPQAPKPAVVPKPVQDNLVTPETTEGAKSETDAAGESNPSADDANPAADAGNPPATETPNTDPATDASNETTPEPDPGSEPVGTPDPGPAKKEEPQ